MSDLLKGPASDVPELELERRRLVFEKDDSTLIWTEGRDDRLEIVVGGKILATPGPVPPRRIPPWDPSSSDGCTSMPSGWREIYEAGCKRHDEDYYYGGSRWHRRQSDEALRRFFIAQGMPRAGAWFAVNVLVRAMGAPAFRARGVSWAHGGGVFKYTEKPKNDHKRWYYSWGGED